MITEEEKEAIKNAKEEFEKTTFLSDIGHRDLGILLNLITRLQNTIIKQSKDISDNLLEMQKKDKVINEMAEYINEAKIMNKAIPVYPTMQDTPYTVGVASAKEIKQYFYGKVENDE